VSQARGPCHGEYEKHPPLERNYVGVTILDLNSTQARTDIDMSAGLPPDYDWRDNILDVLDEISEQIATIQELKRTVGDHRQYEWNVYWREKLRRLEVLSDEFREEIENLRHGTLSE
jgi:hypothetical protein